MTDILFETWYLLALQDAKANRILEWLKKPSATGSKDLAAQVRCFWSLLTHHLLMLQKPPTLPNPPPPDQPSHPLCCLTSAAQDQAVVGHVHGHEHHHRIQCCPVRAYGQLSNRTAAPASRCCHHISVPASRKDTGSRQPEARNVW